MSDPIDPWPDLLRCLVAKYAARAKRRSETAAYNPLPANCPFTQRLPKGRDYIRDAIEDGIVPCCRILQPSWAARDNHPPLCRVEADAVYRFFYTHAFGAHAMILVGKRRDEITVKRRYHAGMFNEGERFAALLSDADWQRLQDALAAVDFWSLSRVVRRKTGCLDGYNMIVEGRRGDEFRATTLEHPDVQETWWLCRTAFDLGGLADVQV